MGTAVFRKTFTLNAYPKRCLVTVTAGDPDDYTRGGRYMVFLNGRKVGEHSDES